MPPLESRIGITVGEPVAAPRWSIEFSARLAAEQDRVAATLLEETTDDFAVFDIRSYARLSDALTLTAGLLNVTDVNYQTYFDARRTFFSEGSQNSFPVFQPGFSAFFGAELMY